MFLLPAVIARKTSLNSVRRNALLYLLCIQSAKFFVSTVFYHLSLFSSRFSKLINSTERTWQLILSSLAKTKEEISTMEELIQKRVDISMTIGLSLGCRRGRKDPVQHCSSVVCRIFNSSSG